MKFRLSTKSFQHLFFLRFLFEGILYSQGFAIHPPKHDLGIGPGIGVINDLSKNYIANFDISYTHGFHSVSINTKMIKTGNLINWGFQSEFTKWYFLNFGGGIGYMFGDRPAPIYHLFTGFPIGDDILPRLFEPFHILYAEPYYRLNFFHKKKLHEWGLMVKITTYEF